MDILFPLLFSFHISKKVPPPALQLNPDGWQLTLCSFVHCLDLQSKELFRINPNLQTGTDVCHLLSKRPTTHIWLMCFVVTIASCSATVHMVTLCPVITSKISSEGVEHLIVQCTAFQHFGCTKFFQVAKVSTCLASCFSQLRVTLFEIETSL